MLDTMSGICYSHYMTRIQKKQYEQEREARFQTAEKIVATGVCPDCGTGLIHNSALTGWWQCGGYASDGFRKPGFENAPKCGFQTFTRG